MSQTAPEPSSAPDPVNDAPGAPRKSAKTSRGSRSGHESAVPLIRPLQQSVLADKPLLEQVKEEARTGLPGLGASIALHALMLLVMAFIVVTREDESGEGALQLGWINTETSDAAAAGETEEKSFRFAPVQIASVSSSANSDGKAANSEPTGAGELSASRAGPNVEPVATAGRLSARSPRLRLGTLEKSTGNKDSVRRCVDAGLAWLSRQQLKSGNWQLHEGYPDAGERTLRTDTGATALALLALLGDGNTPSEGPHKDAVRRGLSWLKGIQKSNGDFHDHVELGRQTAFYAHSQATIAMCEAYALSGDASLRDSAERAIQFLITSQHPTQGGWRYQPQDEKSMGDLSVTGWCLMALHTARMANLEVPAEAFGGASVFLDSCEVKNGARYKYLPSDAPAKFSAAMTAEGLLCRQWLGWPKDWPPLQDGVEYLQSPELLPQWSAGQRNVYEWYYIAQTLHNLGGDAWKTWYGHVQSLVVEHQLLTGSRKPGADVAGSWNPVTPRGANEEYSDKAGRLYLTAMCLLVLETPYRHTPIYGEDE